MSDVETYLFLILLLLTIVTGVLFVAFGQITVRKLRKNPKTQEKLGFEVISGYDIVSAAQALALPMSIMNKLQNSAISGMFSNADILVKHTNRFDKILGTTFYCFLMVNLVFGIAVIVMNWLAVFD